MIRDVDLIKRLQARLELDSRLTVNPDTARHILKLAAPHILEIMREEVADAKREWRGRDVQL